MNNQNAAYKEFEDIIKGVEAYTEKTSKNATCKKGCAHCCSEYILMRRIETSYLTNTLLQLNRKIRKTIKKQLKLWHKNYFDFFRDIEQDKVLDKHTKLSYYKINNQCPFLNQKEKYCYVYKARPIACRMHFVESKPSLCNPKNTSGGVVRWSHSEAYTKINPALEGIEQKYDMVPEKAPFETFNRIYLWEKGTNFLLK